jgi:hypothetical protein
MKIPFFKEDIEEIAELMRIIGNILISSANR